jgi:TolA-binding protein
MPTTRHRGIVMTQEQLMKVKIKYLEDRIDTMEKSLSRINNILGRFQMTENQEQGFKDLEDIKDHVSKVKIVGDHELI